MRRETPGAITSVRLAPASNFTVLNLLWCLAPIHSDLRLVAFILYERKHLFHYGLLFSRIQLVLGYEVGDNFDFVISIIS